MRQIYIFSVHQYNKKEFKKYERSGKFSRSIT